MKIEEFLTRKWLTKADFLRILGEDPKSSILSSYAKGRSGPSFEMLQKMMLNGMYIDEAFDDDVAKAIYATIEEKKTVQNPKSPVEIVIEGLRGILSELENKKLG